MFEDENWMRVRILVALAVVGFASPWLVPAIQMHQNTPLGAVELRVAPATIAAEKSTSTQE